MKGGAQQVYPVMGEVGRYRVQSRSNASETHLVDVLEGQCGCADYVMNRVAKQAETGRPYRCYHIRAARLFALETYLEEMRAYVASR